jgi:hypothetical protein
VIALLKGLYAALTGTPSVGAVSATNTVNTTGIVPSTGNLLINSTDVSAYRSVTLQVTPVSTAAGTFQAQVSSDGTNWVYISGQSSAPSSGGTTTSSYLSGSGGNYLIATTSFNTFQLTGARYFRVYIPSGSGTGTVNTTAFFSSLPVQPTLVQDSSNNLLVAGTVTANGGPNATFTYSATIPSTPTTIIGPITCSNYKVASVHFVALGTGASFTAQYSNDGTNWVSAPTQRCDSPGSFGQSFGSFTSPGAGQMHQVYLYGAQYFRIFGSSTSGTTTIIVNLSQTLLQIPVQYVINTNALTTNPQVGVTTASSGFSSFHSLSCAASTNATSVKATAGQIGSLILSNNASTWAYFHLVNKTSAPTVGTDSGLLNIGVAPNSTLDCSASFAGLRLSSGIAYYVSTGPSATDTGALAAANTFVINLAYA